MRHRNPVEGIDQGILLGLARRNQRGRKPGRARAAWFTKTVFLAIAMTVICAASTVAIIRNQQLSEDRHLLDRFAQAGTIRTEWSRVANSLHQGSAANREDRQALGSLLGLLETTRRTAASQLDAAGDIAKLEGAIRTSAETDPKTNGIADRMVALQPLADRVSAGAISARAILERVVDAKLAFVPTVPDVPLLAVFLPSLLLTLLLVRIDGGIRDAEDSKKISEDFMRLALETANAGWWVTNREAKVASSPIARIIACVPPPDEFGYSDWLANVHPDDIAALRASIASGRHGGTTDIHEEWRVLDPEKGVRWVEAFGQRHMDSQGRVTGASGIILDTTERAEMTAALEQAKREAEAATTAKSRMLRNTIHDLGQPLQTAMVSMEYLKRPDLDPAEVGKVMRRLDTALHSFKSMLGTLGDVARLESGLIRPQVAPVSIQTLLDELSEMYETRFQAKGLGLDIDYSHADLHVVSDPALLTRMVRNLVENALRYTSEGRVVIRCVPFGQNARIEVDDTGPGIPVSEIENVFEEFRRIGNGEGNLREGLGLGLSIVRAFSRILGHKVEVVSEQNVGSRFSIILPLETVCACGCGCADVTEIADEHPAKARKPAGSGPAIFEQVVTEKPDNERPLIVVVDDDRDLLHVLVDFLHCIGCRTASAPDTGGVLAALDEIGTKPDMIVADYRLEDNRTGLETIAAVRAIHGGSLPAFILTAEASLLTDTTIVPADIPVLTKPITLDRLTRVIRSVTAREEAGRVAPAPTSAVSMQA